MKILDKITDRESLEISQDNLCDEVPFNKVINHQCSGCNFAIKRTHHRFFLEYIPKTKRNVVKGMKREKVFFLRKKIYDGQAS